MDLNIRDIKILIYLINKGKTTPLKSVQKKLLEKELALDKTNQNLKASSTSITRSIKKLTALGYIELGIRSGNLKSYYITSKGITYINQICNE